MAGIFYKVGLARQGITKKKGILSWSGLIEELSVFLTMTKTGNGTIVPDVGVHKYEKNEVVEITATETDNDYYFDKFVEDGVDKTDNPLSVTMLANKNVATSFLPYEVLLDSLSQTPIISGSDWVFPSSTGANLLIKQSQVANFNKAARVKFDFATVPNDFTFDCIFYLGSTYNNYENLFNVKGDVFDILPYRTTSPTGTKTTILFRSGASTYTTIHFTTLTRSSWHRITIVKSGTNANITIDGVSTDNTVPAVLYHNYTSATLGGAETEAGAFNIINDLNGYVAYCKYGELLEAYMNNQNGLKVFNSLGDVDGDILNATLATFWSIKSDYPEPYALTKGVTMYYNSSDGTYIAICGDNDKTITNYTKLGYYPAGSGMIEGLPNIVTIPTDSDINKVINLGDTTYATLAAIVNNKYIQLTKTTHSISRLIVKLISASEVSVYDAVYMNSILLTTDRISPNSVYEFTYDAAKLSIKLDSDITTAGYKYLSLLVNGIFNQKISYVDSSYIDITLPAGHKTIKLLNGCASKPLSTILNTRIIDIKGYSKAYSKLSNKSEDKIIYLADSIGSGQAASNYNYLSFAGKFMYIDKIDTTIFGYGYGRLKDFAETTEKINNTVAKLALAFNNTGRKIFIIQVATNDFRLDSTPANTWGTWGVNLIQAVKLVIPDCEIYWQSPLHRGDETSLLSDYRTQVINACESESITHIDGFAIMPANSTYFDTDLLHPKDFGMLTIYNYEKEIILP
jgi:hypothetical protein